MRPKPVMILLTAFVQWTWGIIQSAVGLLLFLVFVRNRHFFFRTSVVTCWKIPYSLGCGMFIFLNDTNLDAYSDELNDKMTYDTLVHEYGHNLQSIILGPLFFPVIAIPSLIWASVPYFQRLRKRKRLSYYWLYCEKCLERNLLDTFLRKKAKKKWKTKNKKGREGISPQSSSWKF